jgi:transcriptional regulator with XRE-family HTH domain
MTDKVSLTYISILKNVYSPPSTGVRVTMLAYIRKYTNMTQTEIAKKIGCSQAHVNQLLYLSDNALNFELLQIQDKNLSVSGAYRLVKNRVENDPTSLTQIP